MNARALALIAQEEARWPLAGDNLIVDLDLSDGHHFGAAEAVLSDEARTKMRAARLLWRRC